jgi:hypothetical protein
MGHTTIKARGFPVLARHRWTYSRSFGTRVSNDFFLELGNHVLDYFGDTYSIFNELHKGHRIPPKKMHVTESSWHCTSAILALHKRNRTPKNYRMRAAKSSHAKIVCQNNRTIGSAALLLNRV